MFVYVRCAPTPFISAKVISIAVRMREKERQSAETHMHNMQWNYFSILRIFSINGNVEAEGTEYVKWNVKHTNQIYTPKKRAMGFYFIFHIFFPLACAMTKDDFIIIK